MDGAHDMGGVAWSEPVQPEPNEPVFHAEWERRAFAITLAMSMPGGWNIDMSRFAREDRPPEDYLSKSYYQIWLAGLERLMLERQMISTEEVAAGKSLHPAKPVTKTLTPDGVAGKLQPRRPAPCPAFPVTPMGRCFASLGKLRLLRWRSHCTRADYSPGMNGRPRLLMRSSARKRPAIPTPEKLITGIGWRHSNA